MGVPCGASEWAYPVALSVQCCLSRLLQYNINVAAVVYLAWVLVGENSYFSRLGRTGKDTLMSKD